MTGKRDKKEDILAAMLDLVVERGFHNAPMSLLAQRSGASPGVIYHYFPSKDDVIRAVYTRVASMKQKALLSGFSAAIPARDALLQIWLNAYRFYRGHPQETRFLEQYQSSPYCAPSAQGRRERADPAFKYIQNLIRRPRSKGGILKDLPPEAIDSFTLGLAASLAKAPRTFSAASLKRIADTAWSAISDE